MLCSIESYTESTITARFPAVSSTPGNRGRWATTVGASRSGNLAVVVDDERTQPHSISARTVAVTKMANLTQMEIKAYQTVVTFGTAGKCGDVAIAASGHNGDAGTGKKRHGERLSCVCLEPSRGAATGDGSRNKKRGGRVYSGWSKSGREKRVNTKFLEQPQHRQRQHAGERVCRASKKRQAP